MKTFVSDWGKSLVIQPCVTDSLGITVLTSVLQPWGWDRGTGGT